MRVTTTLTMNAPDGGEWQADVEGEVDEETVLIESISTRDVGEFGTRWVHVDDLSPAEYNFIERALVDAAARELRGQAFEHMFSMVG